MEFPIRKLAVLFSVAMLIAFTARAQSDPAVSNAVSTSLGFLAKKSLAWKEEHNCASCHHAPMMLWSANEARHRGYPVDEAAVTTIREWLLSPKNEARLLPHPAGPSDRDLFSPAAANTTLALHAGYQGDAAKTALSEFQRNFISHQEKDGSFLINGHFVGTPPILEGGAIGTLLACLALNAYRGETEDATAAARQGAVWLAVNDGSPTQQELALRLLLATRKGRSTEIMPLVEMLVALQRADGSWAQTPEREGDAYATGQALYALASLKNDVPRAAIEKGVQYLLRTQRPEGDWAVLSRLIKPGKSVEEENEPIVAAGTAWALLGILAGTGSRE